MTSRHSQIKLTGAILVVLLLFYSCPFQKITGLPCPGCNMKTSLYYLLKGNLSASLYYHAMAIPTIFCIFFCILFRNNKKRIHILLWIWCIGMIFYYIYRMFFIFPNDPMIYDVSSLLGVLYEKIILYH
ncbi:MAG: DUF2752 domain-containing protein [Floccifex sp.]